MSRSHCSRPCALGARLGLVLGAALLLAACGPGAPPAEQAAIPSPAAEASPAVAHPAKPREQAVLLYIMLPEESEEAAPDTEAVYRLADELDATLAGDHEAGLLDGEECLQGYCIVFMYGPDADRLFDVIAPVIEQRTLAPGSYLLKRYGARGAPEHRIDLAPSSA